MDEAADDAGEMAADAMDAGKGAMEDATEAMHGAMEDAEGVEDMLMEKKDEADAAIDDATND